MPVFSIILYGLIIVLINQSIWFAIAWKNKDNGYADVGYGLGYIGMSWLAYLTQPGSLQLTLLVLIHLWGLRLSIHIFIRNRMKKSEDWRYKAWREDWGPRALFMTIMQVFLLQGLIVWVVGFSILQTANEEFEILHPVISILGLGIALIGWLWESIADYQLLQFKKSNPPKGKLFQGGLWKLSRHPNYFGEIVFWWGIFLFTLSTPYYLFSWISPALITYLVIKVSGVAMLERKQKKQKGFEDFSKDRPALLPNLNLLNK